jgi:O-antigen polymerase
MKRITVISLFFLFIVVHINSIKLYVELNALYYVGFLGFTIIAIAALIATKSYKPRWIDALIYTILILDVLNEAFFQKNIYGNPRQYITLSAGALYFGFSFLLQSKKNYLSTLFWCVAIGVGIQSILAFAQVMGLTSSNSEMFLFSGSFGNPSAFATYLSIVSPFLVLPLLYRQELNISENQYYALLACFISCVCWIAFSNSRGAWAACLLSGFLIANQKMGLLSKVSDFLKSKWAKGSVAILAALVVVSAIVGLYYYKKDSAFGRVLVWKITAQHLPTNILLGNGVGAFEANYGKWQAQYFSSGMGTAEEKKVADYVTCAYNEYLEVLIDKGPIALLLLGLLAVILIKTKTEDNLYVLAAKSSIIASLIIAFVGYPLRLIPVLLHLSLCAAIVLNCTVKDPNKRWSFSPIMASVALMLVTAFCFIKGINYTRGFSLLRKGQQQVFAQQPAIGIAEYQKAFNTLQNNGVYLFYYGAALALTKEHAQSIPLLEKAITKASDPNAYVLLGNEYLATKQYNKAESAYTIASHITPAKLYPKYLLAKLYIEMGQTAKAIQQATEVTQWDDKIHTTAADEMRAEMNEFLKKSKT